MSCETETVVKTIVYYVEVERTNQSGSSRFGPVSTKDKGEHLLAVLASRSDITKATLLKEELV